MCRIQEIILCVCIVICVCKVKDDKVCVIIHTLHHLWAHPFFLTSRLISILGKSNMWIDPGIKLYDLNLHDAHFYHMRQVLVLQHLVIQHGITAVRLWLWSLLQPPSREGRSKDKGTPGLWCLVGRLVATGIMEWQVLLHIFFWG